MKAYKNTFVALVLFTLTFTVAVFAASPGQTGFNFLKISPGARNAAMGDVGVAVTSNLYGVYHNPAVMANLTRTAIGFMHHENIFDSRREFVGMSSPLLGGAFSLRFDYFKVGSIESREGPTEEPLGTFDARDMLVCGSLAWPVTERFAVGGTAKYAAEKIGSETADAFLFDVGARIRLTNNVAIGIAGRNVGGKPKFKQEKIDVPMTVAAGAALEIEKMTAGVDVVGPKNDDIKIHIGLERQIVDFLSLRAGYKIGYDEENMAFGVGFVKSIWCVDYAFVPFKLGLGTNHRLALTVQFK